MKLIISLVGIAALSFVTSALGQTAVPPRSHVERFSTPEVRAERSEADATAKLAANANDTEAGLELWTANPDRVPTMKGTATW